MAKAIVTIEIPDDDTCYKCNYIFSTTTIDEDDTIIIRNECRLYNEEVPHFKKCNKCKKNIIKEEDEL